MNLKERIKSWYRWLPDKKRYIEFITALLTVPVLLTVIIANVKSLKTDEGQTKPGTSGQAPQVTFIPFEVGGNEKSSQSQTPFPTPTNQPVRECTREVGPVEIAYPQDGETVFSDPVCIDISYRQGDYCSAVWSYRINSGSWSQYTDKSICLYNLSPGEKNLDIRVKSIASNDEVLLRRTFFIPVPTVTPNASGSAQP